MSHCCDDHAPGGAAELGIARAGDFDAPAFDQAISLSAIDYCILLLFSDG